MALLFLRICYCLRLVMSVFDYLSLSVYLIRAAKNQRKSLQLKQPLRVGKSLGSIEYFSTRRYLVF